MKIRKIFLDCFQEEDDELAFVTPLIKLIIVTLMSLFTLSLFWASGNQSRENNGLSVIRRAANAPGYGQKNQRE